MVNHLLSIGLILIFAFGVQILLSLFVIVFNNRSRQGVHFLLFYIFLSLKIILLTGQSYVHLLLNGIPFAIELGLQVADLLMTPFVFLYFILLFFFFAGIPGKWKPIVLTSFVFVIVALSFAVPQGVRIDFGTSTIEYGYLYELGNMVFYALLLIPCLYMVVRQARAGDLPTPVVAFAVLLLAFIPVLVLEDFSFGYLPSEQRLGFGDHRISVVFPLFYQVLNTTLFYFGVKYGYVFHARGLDSDERLSPELLRTYGISNREAEVIRYIAKGLRNKQIAESMYISPSTVRNHIYNIFRKTGSASRTGLVAKLSQ